MPWSCDGCECGICDDPDCICECRVLCSVSDTQLKELCISYGLASSTSNHRRNTLFKRIYDSGEHIDIFKEGVRRYVMQCVKMHDTNKPTTKKPIKSSITKVKKKKAPAKKTQTCDSDG